MRGRPRPGRRSSRAALVVSNLVPLVAAVLLEWSLTVLLGIYVLELYAVLFWTAVKLPFAERTVVLDEEPTETRFRLFDRGWSTDLEEKRGGIRLFGWLPPVYPRNIPAFVVFTVFVAPLAALVAFIVFALSQPTITTEVVSLLLLGGLAVFLSRGVSFVTEYLWQGGYRDHSTRSLISGPFRYLAGFGVLMIVLSAAVTEASNPDGVSTAAVLVVVVAGKITAELYFYWRDHTEGGRPLFERFLDGDERRPSLPEPPDADPTAILRPRRLAVAGGGLRRGVAYLFVGGDGSLGVLFVGACLLAALVSPGAVLVVAAGVGIPVVALRAFVYWLRYGPLEYRLYADVVIEHDRLLAAPQRRLPRGAVGDVATHEPKLPQLLANESVELRPAGWSDAGPVTARHLPDGERLREWADG
ncbi:uncharacterized protein NP_3796A [Natronomonas pharaonis DSM 2160]|uniref:Uncharacterized protein n=1 Tax=Natronomonas pharaonis (strain ATCC 35678 / DSM 2160 / CIP 103997 / JCM 8858 / NBRC 14720 / NCIMB 2260 / Gabara) TaxID=348780 RepID=A0A1U7EXP3_NATPD|nr:DUF6498-containing protein [Natronomonas pharaonis]CAI49989.1 uncharacterized protein NP_3796A [Natronomonas pharaonis DSM 2160]